MKNQLLFTNKSIKTERGLDYTKLAKLAEKFIDTPTDHANAAKKIQSLLTSGDTGKLLKKLVLKEARHSKIDKKKALQTIKSVTEEITNKAKNGRLFDPFNSGMHFTSNIADGSVGNLCFVNNELMLVQGIKAQPIIFADFMGGILPDITKEDLLKAIVVIEFILEVLSVFLLLFNIVLPKIDWARIAQAFLRGRQVAIPNRLIGIIAMIMEAVKEGATEKLLKAARALIAFLTGNDGVADIWGVLKQGLDLDFWEWVKMIAIFILLMSLDSATGGAAMAAKVTLILALLYEIICKKAPNMKRLGIIPE